MRRRTEVKKMTKEMKCIKCEKKGTNTVFIPVSVARGKMCPECKKKKGKNINAAYPKKKKAQLDRS